MKNAFGSELQAQFALEMLSGASNFHATIRNLQMDAGMALWQATAMLIKCKCLHMYDNISLKRQETARIVRITTGR